MKLLVADYKNIELRVLAFISKDSLLMAAIKDKENVYCEFASKIYRYPVTKYDWDGNIMPEYHVGKQAVLGLGYGMGVDKFIDTVYTSTGQVIPKEFAKSVVDLYRNTYVGVPKFWKTCEQVLDRMGNIICRFPEVSFLRLQKNSIILPLGLPIRYTNLRSSWQMRYKKWKKAWVYDRYKSKVTEMDVTNIYGGKVTENICQGVAGDICKTAIKRLIKAGFPPAGQEHDSLLVVCEDNEIEKVKGLVTKAMTDPMEWWPNLPLEIELKVGKNWLQAK